MCIVYGTTKYIKAPEGRHVAASYGRRENGKGESIAVGFPNPSGGGTPPLRWRASSLNGKAAFSPRRAGVWVIAYSIDIPPCWGFRISVYPKGLKASAKNGII